VSDRPDYALLVLANSPIKTAKDLEGQTLAAVSIKDQNSLATFAWLDAHGVDRSTLKYVEIPAAATLPAMEQNRVVASTFYEPVLSAIMATGKVRVLGYPMDAIGKRFADSVLFGNTKFVADHPDVVNKFLRATQEASVYVGSHESETPQIASEYTGVDPATIPKNVRHGTRGVLLNPSDIQPMIDVLAKYDVIPKRIDAKDIICSCALKR
jgi:NitT/TauT family transport system substrate-binding protein